MTPPPQKDRNAAKQETRDALVAAGLAEFASRGLDAPSLDAICARAGYTRGAFYVHFRDREDFLEAVMEKVFVSLMDAIIATGDGVHDLEETVTRFAAVAAELHRGGSQGSIIGMEMHRVLDACARSPHLRQRFVQLLAGGANRVAEVIATGQRAGGVRSDLDAGSLGHLLVVLAFGVLTAIDTGVPFDFAQARDTVLQLLAAPSPTVA